MHLPHSSTLHITHPYIHIHTAGQDYVNETATITFDPINLEPIICERISLIDDLINEPTETFFVDLSTNDPAIMFENNSATVTIIDNDCEFSIFFNVFSYS